MRGRHRALRQRPTWLTAENLHTGLRILNIISTVASMWNQLRNH